MESFNNPWYDPEQFDRVRLLDPEFDDIIEPAQIFKCITADGACHLAYGDDDLAEVQEWLTDNEEQFQVIATDEYGFKPE
jgi:hypothetical protein